MRQQGQDLWTIDELTARVASVLAASYRGTSNGRVRDIPDLRTVRYYTTLGLIDRPAEMRGRTAYYSTRHLMQLVAIKRLQAQGLSLAEVQRSLVGLPEDALGRLAALPDVISDGTPEAPVKAAPAEKKPRASSVEFWKEAPEPTSREVPVSNVVPSSKSRAEPGREPPPTSALSLLQGIQLEEGISLLLNAARPLDEDDLEAIRRAAGPLMETLRKRGLLTRREGVHE